ncbi:hypothetical protein [Corynebacterium sp. 13CS0277]|uniref:hypothetical protein n=1 Tax=Corynebacterium sp. 13CS0277 TaxID=2071994 RepID=UPI0018EC6A78|nr:hypothetical protein [Corynebacterium sp. 13CS0277]
MTRRITTGIVAAATALSLGMGTAAASPNPDEATSGSPTSAVTSLANTGSSLASQAVGLAISGVILVGVYNFMVQQHLIQPLRTA